jgi:hypothetical protein
MTVPAFASFSAISEVFVTIAVLYAVPANHAGRPLRWNSSWTLAHEAPRPPRRGRPHLTGTTQTEGGRHLWVPSAPTMNRFCSTSPLPTPSPRRWWWRA